MKVTSNWLMSIFPTVRCHQCRINRKTNKARFDSHPRETILAALHARLSALAATVLRGEALPSACRSEGC